MSVLCLWESSFPINCVFEALDSIHIILNCTFVFGCLWYFLQFESIQIFIEYFELYHLTSRLGVLIRIVSLFFESYQSSYGLHDLIQTLARRVLNGINIHLEKVLNQFKFLLNRITLHSCRCPLFTLVESIHTYYDSIQVCDLVSKLNTFRHTYIYIPSYPFCFIIETICK